METNAKRMKLDASNLTIFSAPPPPPENREKTEEQSSHCLVAKPTEILPESIELPPSLTLNSVPTPTILKEPHPEKPQSTESLSQNVIVPETATNYSQPPSTDETAEKHPEPSTHLTADAAKTIIPMPKPSTLPSTGGHVPTAPVTVQGATPDPTPSYPRLPPPPQRPPLLQLRGPHPPFPGPRIGFPRMPPRLSMGLRPDMMLPPVPPGIPSDLWEWFFNSDEDKDGRITAGEVQRLLLKGKWSPFKEETCKMMLDMMDLDKIGTIDAYQMTSLWNSLLDWKNIFDELDTEKRGCLNASQTFLALEKFGYRLSSEFCDAVVDRFASDNDEKGGDPVLCFDDFIQTRVMLKTLTESFQIFDTAKAGVIDLHYEQFLEMVLTNAL